MNQKFFPIILAIATLGVGEKAYGHEVDESVLGGRGLTEFYQQNLDSSDLILLSTAKTNAIKIVGKGWQWNNPRNQCDTRWRMEVEIQLTKVPFTGKSTHRGDYAIHNGPDENANVPPVIIKGLEYGKSYKWRVRLMGGSRRQRCTNAGCTCHEYNVKIPYKWHDPTIAFFTPEVLEDESPIDRVLIVYPKSIVVKFGSLISGNEDSFIANDDNQFELAIAPTGPPFSRYLVIFDIGTREFERFYFDYIGSTSGVCFQRIEILNQVDGVWLPMFKGSTKTPPNEDSMLFLAPQTGSFEELVKDGEISLRIECKDGSRSAVISSEFLRMVLGE